MAVTNANQFSKRLFFPILLFQFMPEFLVVQYGNHFPLPLPCFSIGGSICNYQELDFQIEKIVEKTGRLCLAGRYVLKTAKYYSNKISIGGEQIPKAVWQTCCHHRWHSTSGPLLTTVPDNGMNQSCLRWSVLLWCEPRHCSGCRFPYWQTNSSSYLL